MVKELQDIALDIFRFTSCSQIQLSRYELDTTRSKFSCTFFSVRLLILTIVLLLMRCLFISKSSGARILLIDLLAVTTLNCPGLIPDSFSQVLRLLMLSHRIKLPIITGWQLSSAKYLSLDVLQFALTSLTIVVFPLWAFVPLPKLGALCADLRRFAQVCLTRFSIVYIDSLLRFSTMNKRTILL